MAKINENFLKLPGGYLFPEIRRRVEAFSKQGTPMPLIRLGIGDVTRPLAPAVVEAMHKAVEEMGQKETFRGYCEETCCAYDFLRFAITLLTTKFLFLTGQRAIAEASVIFLGWII